VLFGKVWRGEERTLLKSSRDSPHSRSDRLLQAHVWRGFGLRFQIKSGGRNAGLGQLKEILPLPTPSPLGPGFSFH